MDKKTLLFVIRVLSLFGIVLAVYLLWEQYFHPSFQPCNINSVVNCNAIISGAVAKTFGIPTPLIGLIGYGLILFGSLKKLPKFVLSMATFGLIFCLWIGYKEVVILQVICPVCILCQLDMITTFLLSLLLLRKK